MLNNFMETSLENLYVDHAGIVGLKGLKIPQFSPTIILLCYQISAVKLKLCVPKEKNAASSLQSQNVIKFTRISLTIISSF